MKTICIFSFYNGQGIISEDVFLLLKQLKKVSDRLIFVSNGEIAPSGKEIIYDYTKEVLERENRGRDYGAYRHVIIDYLDKNELHQYDNIILCNDTFYGFFKPLDKIIQSMKNMNYDIWGLNRVERGLLDHIQSYFLVFSGKIISSGDLWNYFYENKVTNDSLGETSAFLEPMLYREMTLKGYNLGSFIFTEQTSIYAYPYECIKKYGLPILKKKSFFESMASPNEVKKAIEYIYSKNLYVKGLIKECYSKDRIESPYAKRVLRSSIDEKTLLNFAEQDFYIFGAGLIAKEIYYTYFKNNGRLKGFVVSNGKDKQAVTLDKIEPGARIIIGVRADTQREIIELLQDKYVYLSLWNE